MAPPSSTSSSEPTSARSLSGWPRVSRAAWAALLTVLLAGAGLRALAQSAPGQPPLPAYPRMATEAFRYAAATGQRRSEIVLFGSSLMHYGVQEDLLARALGDPDQLVINLALDAAGPWEELRLAGSLRPSRATGQRLAILEVNRISMDASRELPAYGAFELRQRGRLARAPGLAGIRDAVWEQVPPRDDLVSYVGVIRDGVIGPRFPSLVPAPPAAQRSLWSVTEMARRRAVRGMSPRVMAGLLAHRALSPHGPFALGLAIAELKRRGFRVLVLQTPLHGEFLDTLAAHPGDDAAERAYRAAVLDPAATGADDVLVFDRAADIGADDSVFVDYGHMSPEGSTKLTERLAEHLARRSR